MIAKLSLPALLLAGAAAAGAAGCTTTESNNILTSGMYASISATADGDGDTTVSTSLYLGPPSDLIFIDLVSGDQLLAHHEGQTKVMTEVILLNIVSHTATFASDAADARFQIELRRRVDDGAPRSIVTLPAPFTLGTVPASVSRTAAFGVAWTGASAASTDRMRWTAQGDCIDPASGPITGDPGSVTMPAGTFKKRMDTTVPDTCQVKVTVVRERDGQLDGNFDEGGTVTGIQTRSLTFTSTP